MYFRRLRVFRKNRRNQSRNENIQAVSDEKYPPYLVCIFEKVKKVTKSKQSPAVVAEKSEKKL